MTTDEKVQSGGKNLEAGGGNSVERLKLPVIIAFVAGEFSDQIEN